MRNRTLYFGDNLNILRDKIPDESFDLIYLDPPFNSNRDYNVLFREGLVDSQAQVQAFEDSWHWTRDAQSTFEELIGAKPSKTKINEQIVNLMQALEKMVGRNDVLAYLTMMTIRLIELRRVLKPTGSIYLHCDPTASHYLKIVMDAVFGKKNFRREIVWRSGWVSGFKTAAKNWIRNHDTILYYLRDADANFFFDLPRRPHPEGYKRRGGGENPEGVALDDVWTDIYSPAIMSFSKEKLGYPTQKPETLLERILRASSRHGDWVLDPFCGCGTTVAVAERLNRNWVGIDITALAINLIKHRLHKQFPDLPMSSIVVDGLPKDLTGARALFKRDPFEFEYWALDLVNAIPAQSKSKDRMRGPDRGIDGIITIVTDIHDGERRFGKLLVQVKGGAVHRDDIATLKGDIEREKAIGGVFITLEEPTRPMVQEVVQAGSYSTSYAPGKDFPKVQILTVKELLTAKRLDMPLWSEPYYKEAKRAERELPFQQGRIEL